MKNRYFIIILVLLCFILTGCGGPTDHQKDIYNSDKLISSEGDSYYSTHLTLENNNIELGNLTGSYTIWEEKIDKANNINITINNNINNGKYKMVLIKDDSIYKTITTYKDKDEDISYNLEPGNYRIKIIGLETTGSIKYNIKIKNQLNS